MKIIIEQEDLDMLQRLVDAITDDSETKKFYIPSVISINKKHTQLFEYIIERNDMNYFRIEYTRDKLHYHFYWIQLDKIKNIGDFYYEDPYMYLVILDSKYRDKYLEKIKSIILIEARKRKLESIKNNE